MGVLYIGDICGRKRKFLFEMAGSRAGWQNTCEGSTQAGRTAVYRYGDR
jgi:hypothetical protein